MGRGFFIAVIGFAAGIALGTFYSVPVPVSAFVGLLGVIILLFARSAASMGAALLVMFVAFGLIRVALEPSAPPDAFLPLFDTNVELVGTVKGDPDIRETTQRVTVEVEHEGARMRLLAVLTLHPELPHGERISVAGKLERPEPFDTDGGRVFRYDRFLAKDGIFGIVEYAQVEKLEGPVFWSRVQGSLYAVKHAFTDGLGRALPEPYAGLAAGIIAGGKQGLGKELLDAFTIAGLVHIVVLSGYNVMIVAEGVLRMFGFLKKRVAASAAAFTIGLFVLAAGAGAASIRAGTMVGVALFARASGRTYDALRALLLVLMLMLLANPLLLVHDPGFQFSFAATLGLILAASPLEARLVWVRPAFLRDILATTLAAQLFVLPLLLYQTGNLSPLALPANLLALPVVPLAMLCSAIAGVSGVMVPAIAPALGVPALVLLGYLVELTQFTVSLPLAAVTVPAFPFWVVVLLYALLAYGVYRLRTR